MDWRKKPRIKPVKLDKTKKMDQISFQAEPGLKEDLVALSYVTGAMGQYARIARIILKRGILQYIAEDLTPEEQKEYKTILQAVQAKVMVSRMERQAREKQKELEEAAHAIEDETQMPPDFEELPGE